MSRFNAPTIITDVPDIAQIYEINEDQGDELDAAISEMDDNIFLDDMHESQIARWEKILKISPASDDTIEDRRFRVKSKALERLPFSYRVIMSKLQSLCPEGVEVAIDDDRLHMDISLALRSVKMLADVDDLMDSVLPLNMTYAIIILYNQYLIYNGIWTHGEMAAYTHEELRSNVWE